MEKGRPIMKGLPFLRNNIYKEVLRNKWTPLQIVITNGYTCSIFQVAKITKRECSYAPFLV